MVFRGAKPPGRREHGFVMLWRALGGPVSERDFRFHPPPNGRHNRSRRAGLAADLEKHPEAVLTSGQARA